MNYIVYKYFFKDINIFNKMSKNNNIDKLFCCLLLEKHRSYYYLRSTIYTSYYDMNYYLANLRIYIGMGYINIFITNNFRTNNYRQLKISDCGHGFELIRTIHHLLSYLRFGLSI